MSDAISAVKAQAIIAIQDIFRSAAIAIHDLAADPQEIEAKPVQAEALPLTSPPVPSPDSIVRIAAEGGSTEAAQEPGPGSAQVANLPSAADLDAIADEAQAQGETTLSPEAAEALAQEDTTVRAVPRLSPNDVLRAGNPGMSMPAPESAAPTPNQLINSAAVAPASSPDDAAPTSNGDGDGAGETVLTDATGHSGE